MAEYDVRVEGLDTMLKKLARLGPKAARPAIAESAAHIKSKIATYPPRRYGKQPPKTFKQKIFLINAIREGLIDYPYRRGLSPGSQGLGRRWTTEFRDNGLTAIVGNNAGYARYVQDEDEQNEYHRLTGWVTVQSVAEDEADAVLAILTARYRQEINK